MEGVLRRAVVLVVVVLVVASLAAFLIWMRSAQPPGPLSCSLNGAGASFQYPQIAQWASLFQKAKGIKITYQSVGSGAGQSMFLKDRVVDFAASDPPLTREQYEKYRGQVMQIPWIIGAVAVVYNVPEIPGDYNLRLSAGVVARIYMGEIMYWDDQAIKELNPEVASLLPHREIIAVHRSDSSGTTEIFTTFLHKASPDNWPRELVGKTVNWPVDATGRGVSAKGNEGVTATITQTPYSIGYVELSYALEYNMAIASIENAAGKFVLPTEEAVKNSIKGVTLPGSPLDDFSSVIYDAVYSPHPDSYPIASPVFLIVWRNYEDKCKATALSEFLKWVAEEGYENMVPGYVAPPEEARNLLLVASSILVGEKT